MFFFQPQTKIRSAAIARFHLVKWLVEFEGVDLDGPVSRCGFRAIDYAGKAPFWAEVLKQISLVNSWDWFSGCLT